MYVCMYVCIYKYIHTYTYAGGVGREPGRLGDDEARHAALAVHGVHHEVTTIIVISLFVYMYIYIYMRVTQDEIVKVSAQNVAIKNAIVKLHDHSSSTLDIVRPLYI